MRGILKTQGALVAQSEGVSAQFLAAFEDNFALRLASQTNSAAKKLAEELQTSPECRIYIPVETNVVMVSLPFNYYQKLNEKYQQLMVFEDADPTDSQRIVVRFMTNHGTTTEQIQETAQFLRTIVSRGSHA